MSTLIACMLENEHENWLWTWAIICALVLWANRKKMHYDIMLWIMQVKVEWWYLSWFEFEMSLLECAQEYAHDLSLEYDIMFSWWKW